MKNLIYEINNKKYLLFEFNSNSIPVSEELLDKAEDLGGIIQKCDIKRIGFFSNRIEISVLIPEENALTFSKSQNID